MKKIHLQGKERNLCLSACGEWLNYTQIGNRLTKNRSKVDCGRCKQSKKWRRDIPKGYLEIRGEEAYLK